MPECFLDTALVEVLLECSDAVNHKKGNSGVLGTMLEERMEKFFIVAVLDDDKVKVKALQAFHKVERLCKNGLKLYEHPVRKHFIIQLFPAIERWVLNQCAKGDINPELYDLPGNLNGLRKMKGLSQRKDERFRRLFRDMLGNEKCDEMAELKRWLYFFKEKNYKTNIDLL